MPTYAYACQSCGHQIEVMQDVKARVLRKCPDCGKPKLERLISGGAGFIFKGDGFYQTDYKNPKKTAQDSSDKPATEKTEKTEKKPEPAPSKSPE